MTNSLLIFNDFINSFDDQAHRGKDFIKQMQFANLSKIFLYSFIASIILSVVVGISFVLFGTSEQAGRIFLSTLTLTIASFSMYLNGVFFERRIGNILPIFGFLLTPLCAFFCFLLIWKPDYNQLLTETKPFISCVVLLGANFFSYPFAIYNKRKGALIIPVIGVSATITATLIILAGVWEINGYSQSVEKFGTSAILIAISSFHLSLVLLPNLPKKFAWSQIAIQFCIWSLCAISVWLIWQEFNDNNEFFKSPIFRIIVILGILISAFTLLIPVFAFLSRSQTVRNVRNIDAEIAEVKKRLVELEMEKEKLENIREFGE